MRAILRVVILALAAIAPARATAQAVAVAPGLGAQLDRLARGERISGLPSADSVTRGPRVIGAGSHVRGPVVAQGAIDVSGTVEGSVVSLGGDVTVHRGGVVTGDALAVGGRVIADSGRVDGEMRSMSTLPALLAAAGARGPASPARVATRDARAVAQFFVMLLVVALGVLLFAARNLEEVVVTLERQFARAFWTGVAGQMLILPVLLVLVVALALTVIGILLIPFAIVAYGVAVIGIMTLGFLAVARIVGGALWRHPGTSSRGQLLGAMGAGIGLFFVLWMMAALLGFAPLAASVLRAAAMAATWAAVTLGMGAAILSRAGTHRRVAGGVPPVTLAAWQTPTPIGGVIAARRPVAVAGDPQ